MAKKAAETWAITDADEKLTLVPGALLPAPRKAIAMLTAVEKGQKNKRVLLEHFPVLPLQYWQLVEEEFRKQHLYSQITSFTRAARAWDARKKASRTRPAYLLSGRTFSVAQWDAISSRSYPSGTASNATPLLSRR